MASKLKALLAKKQLLNAFNKPFKEEKKITGWIEKLNKNKNEENLWGWWNKDKTSSWISSQVIEAMLMAEKTGYKVDFNKQAVISHLVTDLNSTIILPFDSIYFNKQNWYNKLLLLQTLDAKIDYAEYISRIEKIKDKSLYEKLLGMKTKQLAGIPIDMDSLMYYSHKTILGSMYWDERTSDNKTLYNYSPYDNQAQYTLLAYQLLKNQGGYEKELELIRNYFFEMRRDGYWKNTYESSRIIETILPDMLTSKNEKYENPVLEINGNKQDTFPCTLTLDASPLKIKKSGTPPVFFTAYQQAWNTNPDPVINKGFEIKTTFTTNNDTISELKAGKVTELNVVLNVLSDAEYVMVEIPIPAGCSYESKPVYQWNEIHREYLKEKVSIFYNRLQQGEHRFSIRLIPRFNGKYNLNPARVELMYFPVFYGREALKIIEAHSLNKKDNPNRFIMN